METAKQAERKFRAQIRAEGLSRAASAAFDKAHKMAEVIPFGQPILVGHHSERGDRRYRDKITRNMVKGVELHKAAEKAQWSAALAGRAVTSDDPEAIEALTEKVEKLEANQAQMKAANKLIRKGDRAGVVAMFGEKVADELFKPDFMGRLGFPSYAITNNNANIRRIRDRIAFLQRQAVTPPMEPIIGDGWTIREDLDDQRIVIEFNHDLRSTTEGREMLKKLRQAAFKWSPTRGTFIRLRNPGAIYAAKRLMGVL